MSSPQANPNADPAKKETASRLAREVIDCDPAILSLIIVDGLGRILAVARSSRLPESDYMKADLVPKFGVLAQLIIGAAGNAVPLMGPLEFIIGAFKNEKVLLVNLPKYELVIALRLSRSSEAEYVSHKLEALLGSFS